MAKSKSNINMLMKNIAKKYDEEVASVYLDIENGKTEDEILSSNKNKSFKWSNLDLNNKKRIYLTAKKIYEDEKVYNIENINNIDQLKAAFDRSIMLKDINGAFSIVISYLLKNFTFVTLKEDKKEKEVWYYNNGIYQPNGKSMITEWCSKFFGDSYLKVNENRIQNKIQAETFVEPNDFFNDKYPNLILVKNGILDIKTGILSEYDSSKYFFTKFDIEYNKKSKINKIEKFMRDVVEDELSYKTIQEFFGYCLYRKYPIQKSLILLGHGSNGKSQVLNLLIKFLGHKNVSHLAFNDLNSDGFGLINLFGKMANVCGDMGNTPLKDSQTFKAITGEDPIDANRKGLSYLTFVNHAKVTLSCNKLPKINDTTDGFLRRWTLLEFKNKFILNKDKFDSMSDEYKKYKNIKLGDPNILEKITSKEELEGLLNWSIEGLQRLLNNNDFSKTLDVDEVEKLWREKSSTFGDFIYKHIESVHPREDCFISKAEVNENYLKWCEINSISNENIDRPALQAKLLLEVFGSKEAVRKKNSSIAYRAYLNIRLKDIELLGEDLSLEDPYQTFGFKESDL